MNIFKSASKFVFILLALTACTAFLYGVFTDTVKFELKDFMVLAGMAFGFFFAYKGDNTKPFVGK